jgi:hypothetical protein
MRRVVAAYAAEGLVRAAIVACIAWSLSPGAASAQAVQEPAPYAQPPAQQGAAPPVVVVQDPGGGGQVAAPPAAPQYAGPDPYRMQALQARLNYLLAERSQYRIGGPITMLAIGGGLFVIGGLSAWALWRAEATDFGFEDRNYTTAAGVFTAIAIVGGVLAVVGGVKLGRRLRMRRQYDPEIRQIREELRMSQSYYGYRALLDVGAGPSGVTLRLRF